MCSSKARGSCPATLPFLAANQSIPFSSARWLGMLLPLLIVCGAPAQDTGNANTEFYGKGTAVTVVVHDASGNPIGSGAIVKLFRGGTMPAGQAETEHGRAELVVTELGDFSVVVAAAGYASVQKDFTIGAAGRTEVDVYLRTLSANSTSAPGRPLLAPKAKKAVDQGLQALSADNLEEAEKQAGKAMHLAPGHPDVPIFAASYF